MNRYPTASHNNILSLTSVSCPISPSSPVVTAKYAGFDETSGLGIFRKSSKIIYFPIDLRFFRIKINGQPALIE
jgi:hypothetical protein